MIVKNYIELRKALEWLDSKGTVAYDLETTGLEPRKNMVIGVAIGTADRGFYIVHQHYNPITKVYDQYLNKEMLKPLFDKLKTKKLITWNGSFDIRFTRHYFGVDLASSIWCEGMLSKHAIDEERPFALKDVAKRLYGDSATQEQKDLYASIAANGGSAGHVWLGDLELVGRYAAQDAMLTYKINKHYIDLIQQHGMWKFYQDDEVMPLYREVTIEMEDKGIRLDIPLLQQSRIDIARDISLLEATIREKIEPHLEVFDNWYMDKTIAVKRSGEFAQQVALYLGVKLPLTKTGNFSFAKDAIAGLDDCLFKRFILGTERLPETTIHEVRRRMQGNQTAFNLMSKHHWKKVFFSQLGETPLSYTDVTKEPQLDDDFLESVKSKHDFVPLLLDFNRLNKIKSTYIDRFLEEQIDGRFYPSFMQHTTISGRYSGDLQQLNRPIEESAVRDGTISPLVFKYNNLIRSFFIADEGYSFVDTDYESLEPHVFAHVSGDQGLKDIFIHNKDFYSTIAIMTEGLTGVSAFKKDANYLGTISKAKRQASKEYALGIPYGKSGYALAKSLNIPVPTGEELHKRYLDAFPALARWMENSKQQCLTEGWVQSEAGRVRHMPDAPKLYAGYGEVLLDPLKLYDKYGKNKTKYEQMKFLSGKLRNYVNNSRNFQIQSLAASITNRASIAINRAFKAKGWDAVVVAQIHDQLVCSVPEVYVDEACKIVQNLMETVYPLSIPLKAPPAVAKNLRDGH